MNHDELYNQAMNGDAKAFEELKAGAEVGNPDAQSMLSCLYGNMDSPFYNEKQYDYWQDRIEQDTHIEPQPEEVTPNDYVPNWTFSDKEEKTSTEEQSEKAEPQSLSQLLFSSEGRMSRSEYLCVLVIYFAILASIVMSINNVNTVPPSALLLLGFLIFFPAFNAAIRRCHDIGTYGFCLIIPFYFVLLLSDKNLN